ncbi:hypothetical protein PUN28_012994 [Cardiocondyla obscurior]|uniref:Photosystem I assembly protein Ycf4 n=1 Tax=Cardiocondyla obscurior TaxID=286306 RepID=A0AAW2F6G2_9HYME
MKFCLRPYRRCPGSSVNSNDRTFVVFIKAALHFLRQYNYHKIQRAFPINTSLVRLLQTICTICIAPIGYARSRNRELTLLELSLDNVIIPLFLALMILLNNGGFYFYSIVRRSDIQETRKFYYDDDIRELERERLI